MATKQLLFSNDFRYILIEQYVQNSRAFLSALVQRLKDLYLQSWYAELADSSKLCLYKDYKLYYEHETYLNYLNIRAFRHTLTKFRSGRHNLEFEVGRHHGLPSHDRLCRLCKDEVENEIHFMLQCPVYETLRQKYLPRKYYYISECKQVYACILTSHSRMSGPQL